MGRQLTIYLNDERERKLGADAARRLYELVDALPAAEAVAGPLKDGDLDESVELLREVARDPRIDETRFRGEQS